MSCILSRPRGGISGCNPAPDNFFARILVLCSLGIALAGPSASQEEEDPVAVVERVVILGSHASADFAASTQFPGALSRQDIQGFGRRSVDLSVADFLASTSPVPTMDSLLHPGGEYASGLNLHGLGIGRTLILMDGRRLGDVPLNLSGWHDAAPSLADLPSSMLAGVQILPAANASLYGSGAMGGIVNLVTREAFTGVELGFVNTEIAEAEQVQNTDFVFSVGRKKANFMMAWEEGTQPELALLDRQWALDFQSAWPEFTVAPGNGSPGVVTFDGALNIPLFTDRVPSCLRAGETFEFFGGSFTASEDLLCGDEAVVFDGIQRLQDLLPDNLTQLQAVDPSCADFDGLNTGEQCRYRFGSHLMLRQRQDSEKLFLNYTHELAPGTEMRVQYLSHDSSIPIVRGIAQRNPVNSRWRTWQVPLNHLGVDPLFLNHPDELGAFLTGPVTGGIRGFAAEDLPDGDFFLSQIQNRDPTEEEVEWAALLAELINGCYQSTDCRQVSFIESINWPALLTWPAVLPEAARAGFTYSGNILGSAGSSVYGSRDYRRQRYAWDMQGQFGVSGVFYRAGAAVENAFSRTSERDLLVQNVDRALRGYGAPSCNYEQAVELDIRRRNGEQGLDLFPGAGRGGCFYLFPLGSGLVVWDDPTVSLISGVPSSELLTGPLYGNFMQSWLFGRHTTEREQQSVQFDALFEGRNAPGTFAWAAGAEFRYGYFQLKPVGYADASRHSSDFIVATPENDTKTDNDATRSQLDEDADLFPLGPFAHLSAIHGRKARRNVLSLFGDMHFDMDALDLQVTGRLEASDDAGSQFASGLLLSWQSSKALTLTASVGQSFRFPSLIQLADLDHRTIHVEGPNDYLLALTGLAGGELQSEQGQHLNFGLYYEANRFLLQLRHWQTQLDDPIALDPLQPMVDAYLEDGTFGAQVGTPIDCADEEDATGDVTGDDCTVRLYYRNGPGIDAAGWGLHLGYDLSGRRGRMGIGLDLGWLQQYRVDDYRIDGTLLAPEFDAAGRYNMGYAFGSLPEWRAVLQLDWQWGLHHLQLRNHLTSSYEDSRHDNFEIASFAKWDLGYSYRFPSRKVELSLDLSNLLDEDPPTVLTPLGYDRTQHDPYGRIIRLGVVLSYP